MESFHSNTQSIGKKPPWDFSTFSNSGLYQSQDIFLPLKLSKSSSQDSLSRSSVSLSSASSSDKNHCRHANESKEHAKVKTVDASHWVASGKPVFGRQISHVSSAGSLPSSITDFPDSVESSCYQGSCSEVSSNDNYCSSDIKDKAFRKKFLSRSHFERPNRNESHFNAKSLYGSMNARKSSDSSPKSRRKQRDLIVQDEEEEEFPFAKYTFNKKKRSEIDEDSNSSKSRANSLSSVGVIHQFRHLQDSRRAVDRSTSSSIYSSITSSSNEPNYYGHSIDDNVSMDNSMYESGSPKFRQDFTQRGPAFDRPPGQPNFHYGMYNQPRPGVVNSDILSNLGFEEARSILPERFLWSWIEKVVVSQQEEYARRFFSTPPAPLPTPTHPYPMMFPGSQYSVEDPDLPPSVSAQQSGASTPKWHRSLENIFQPGIKQDNKRNMQRHAPNNGNVPNNSFDKDFMFSRLQAVKKENSFDKLKRILQTTEPVPYKDKDMKRSSFASSRQKSLPIFLDTLSEEDEEKRRSRSPSIDKIKFPVIKDSNMKTFLEEEDRASLKASSSEELCEVKLRCTFELGAPGPSSETIQNKFKRNDESEDSGSDIKSYTSSEGKTLPLPCIVVSEKENELSEYVDSRGKYKTFGDKPVVDRPISPNPNTQLCLELNSKDSLEIAEILSPKEKIAIIPVLTKIDSISSDERSMQVHTHVNQSSFKFLSPTGNYDLDDKYMYLSPTPSISSPLLMSPVTVIELNKLDNQNDSLDNDDQKSRSCGPQNSDKKEKSDTSTLFDTEALLKSQKGSHLSTKGLQQYSLHPRSLAADRNSYKNSQNHNFDNRCMDTCVQVDLQKLTPLIKMSDILRVHGNDGSRLPDYAEENLFYLAQDKEVQCNLKKEDISDAEDRTNSVNIRNNVLTILKHRSHDNTAEKSEAFQTSPQQETCSKTENLALVKEILLKLNQYLDILNKHNDLLTETKDSICQFHGILKDKLGTNAENCIDDSKHTKSQTYKSEAFLKLMPRSTVSHVNGPKKVQADLIKNQTINKMVLEEAKTKENLVSSKTEMDYNKELINLWPLNESCKPNDSVSSKFYSVGNGSAVVKQICGLAKIGGIDMSNVPPSLDKSSDPDEIGGIDMSNVLPSLDKSSDPDEIWGIDMSNVPPSLDKSSDPDEIWGIDMSNVLPSLDKSSDLDEIGGIDTSNDPPSLDPFASEEEFFEWLDTVYPNVIESPVRQEEAIDDVDYHIDAGHTDINGIDERGSAQPSQYQCFSQLVLAHQDDGFENETILEQQVIGEHGNISDNTNKYGQSYEKANSPKAFAETDISQKIIKQAHAKEAGSVEKEFVKSHTSYLFKHPRNQSAVDEQNDTRNQSAFDEQNDTRNQLAVDEQNETMSVGNKIRGSGFSSKESVDTKMCNKRVERNEPDNDRHVKVLTKHTAMLPEGVGNCLRENLLSTRSLDFDSTSSRRLILKRCRNSAFSKSIESTLPYFDMSLSTLARQALQSTNLAADVIEEPTVSTELEGQSSKSATVDRAQLSVMSSDNLSERGSSVEIIEELCQDDVEISQSKNRLDGLQRHLEASFDDNLLSIKYGLSSEDFGRLAIAEHVKSQTNYYGQDHVCSSMTNCKCSLDKTTTFDMYASIDLDDASILDTAEPLSEDEFQSLPDLSRHENLISFKENEAAVSDPVLNKKSEFDNNFLLNVASSSNMETDFENKDSENLMFNHRPEFYENHMCRNCGHTVSIAIYEEGRRQVEHDFCQVCSPLKLSADILEQKRCSRYSSQYSEVK